MLAAEKHKGTFMAPIGIGLSLFIAEITGMTPSSSPLNPTDPVIPHRPIARHQQLTKSLTGVYFTGGSLNPARSFGPAVITRSFAGYHWIYWAGPLLGAVVAAGFYKFIKILEYETANPGQDDAHAAQSDAELRLRQARIMSNGTTAFVSVGGLGVSGAGGQADGLSGTAAGGEKLGEGFGAGAGASAAQLDGTSGEMSPTATADGRLARPAGPRQTNSRARVESPAMGTPDDAFHGLAHGMHGEDRSVRPQASLAVADGARLRTATRSPGQVV